MFWLLEDMSCRKEWLVSFERVAKRKGSCSTVGDGIRLLDEWGFFDPPEPRLAHLRWLRLLEAAIRTSRIYYSQLGKAAG
jgi:hypothetical protein